MKKSFARLLNRFSTPESRPTSQGRPFRVAEDDFEEEVHTIDDITQGIQVFSTSMEALLHAIASKEDPIPEKVTLLQGLLKTIREQIDLTAETTTLVWDETIDHNLDALDDFVQQLAKCEENTEMITSVSTQLHERANILLRAYTKQITAYLRGEDEIGDDGLLPTRPKSSHSQTRPQDTFDPFDEGVLRPKLQSHLLDHNKGVSILLAQTKRWSKFMKDVLLYFEKRASIVADYEKKLSTLARSHLSTLEVDDTFPCKKEVQEMYNQHIDYAQRMLEYMSGSNAQLQFDALSQLRNNQDRQRKHAKESWTRSSKRLHETQTTVSKQEARYFTAASEWDKAVTSRSKAQSALYKLKLEKRIKEEADTRTRLVEARALYQKGVEDFNNTRSQHIRVRDSIISDLTGVLFESSQAVRDSILHYHSDLHKVHVALHIESTNLLERTSSYRPAPDVVETIAGVGGFFVSMDENLEVHPEVEDEDEAGDEATNGLTMHGQQAISSGDQQDDILDFAGDVSIMEDDDTNLPSDEQPADTSRKIDGAPRRESFNVVHDTLDMADDEPHHAHNILTSGITTTASTVAAAIGIGGKDRRRSSAPSVEGEVLPSREFLTFNLCDSAREFLVENQLPNLCLAIENQRDDEIDLASSFADVTTNNINSTINDDGTENSEGIHVFARLNYPTKCQKCKKTCYFNSVVCNKCNSAYHKTCAEKLDVGDVCTPPDANKLSRKRSVFGSSIQSQSTEKVDGVPIIIRRITEVLERTAMDCEGLYRLSGVKSQVESLCASFEANPRTVCIDDEYPIVLAAVLKLYLRELTEPLISPAMVAQCLEIGQWRIRNFKEEHCEFNTAIKLTELLDALPHVNYNTLAFLCAHLQRVSFHQDQNKMAAKNLGIVFGPTLLPSKASSLESLMQMPVQSTVVEIMIKYCEDVFVTYFETRPAQRPSAYERILESASEGSMNDRKHRSSRKRNHRFSATMIKDSENEGSFKQEQQQQQFQRRSRLESLNVSKKKKHAPSPPQQQVVDTSSSEEDNNEENLILGFPDDSVDGETSAEMPTVAESSSHMEIPMDDAIPPVLRKSSNRSRNRVSGKVYDVEENSTEKEQPGEKKLAESTGQDMDEMQQQPGRQRMPRTLSMDEPTYLPPSPPSVSVSVDLDSDEMPTKVEEEGGNDAINDSVEAVDAVLKRSRYSSYGSLPETPPPPPPEDEDDEEEEDPGNFTNEQFF